MAGIQKTNVARLLDKAKIHYELVPYTVDENNLAADHVAEELGEEYAQYIKRSNIVGDVLAQFFFEDGTSMDLQERYRQTAFAIEKLPKVPKTICLAGGKDKVDALYAGSRAGFFTTLVPESVTARLLYEKIRRQIEQ